MYIGPVYDEMIDIHYAQKNLKIDTDLNISEWRWNQVTSNEILIGLSRWISIS